MRASLFETYLEAASIRHMPDTSNGKQRCYLKRRHGSYRDGASVVTIADILYECWASEASSSKVGAGRKNELER